MKLVKIMEYSDAITVSTSFKTPGQIERLDELPETQRDPFCQNAVPQNILFIYIVHLKSVHAIFRARWFRKTRFFQPPLSSGDTHRVEGIGHLDGM